MIVRPPSPPPAADRIWHAHSFNVGTAGAKIFTGPAAEEFGYQVQQAANHEGKWYEMSDVAGKGFLTLTVSGNTQASRMLNLNRCLITTTVQFI